MAESCKGGLIGGSLTSVAGSSAYFSGGVIAYSNEVKQKLLGVEPELLARSGTVSRPVSGWMAVGVSKRLDAYVGISVTGIAGPGGGSTDKPVGLVYVGGEFAKQY